MEQRPQSGGPSAATAPPDDDARSATTETDQTDIGHDDPEIGHAAHDATADQVGALADEALRRLQDQAAAGAQRAADRLHRIGAQLVALADGRPDDAEPMDDHARRAGGEIARLADRIEQRGFEGLVADVEDLARRRPGLFVAGAAVAGLLAGQLGRPRRPETPSTDEAPRTDSLTPPHGRAPTSPGPRVPDHGTETTDGNGDRRR